MSIIQFKMCLSKPGEHLAAFLRQTVSFLTHYLNFVYGAIAVWPRGKFSLPTSLFLAPCPVHKNLCANMICLYNLHVEGCKIFLLNTRASKLWPKCSMCICFEGWIYNYYECFFKIYFKLYYKNFQKKHSHTKINQIRSKCYATQ